MRITTRRAGAAAALLALCSLTLAGDAGCGAAPERPPRPDVIVLLLDTLRPDHLELYGYEAVTAPFLAGLAERSAVFVNAFSTSSWTAPATASLFTALYPTRSGVVRGFFAHNALVRESGASLPLPRLPATVATLPERFRHLGYATFGISANINIGPEIGFDRGFDRFERLHNASAEVVAERVFAWEPELRSRAPFFLYLHLNDVHGPHEPRAPWYRETGDERGDVRAAYDSEIRYVDAALERLLGRLDPASQGVLAVLSDHGQELWERGELGHKFTLHQEVNRVLLLVHAPALGISPGVIETNVSLVDVAPTLVELLGAEGFEDGDGASLAPLLQRDASARSLEDRLEGRPVFAHRVHRHGPEELWAVVRGRYKLIEHPEWRAVFDLESDPTEQLDLSQEEPVVASQLAREIEAFRAAPPRATPELVEVPLDAELLEHLRELGYVGDDR